MADLALIARIQGRLSKGESEEHIREALLKEGIDTADINGAFASLKLRQRNPGIAQREMPMHRRSSTNIVLDNILLLVLFFSGAPLAYAFYNNVIGPALDLPYKHVTVATSTDSVASGSLGVAPLIPVDNSRPQDVVGVTQSSSPVAKSVQTVATIIADTVSTVVPTPTPVQQPLTLPQTVSTSTPSTPTQPTTPPDQVPDTTPPPDETTPVPVDGPTPPENPLPPDPTATDTPPVGEPVVPGSPNANYQVYPGCSSPATSYTKTIYVDPQKGSDTGDGSTEHPYKTLGTVLSQKKLSSDTHVVLLPGNHGVIFADSGRNPALNGTGWIWLDFQNGATAQYMDIRHTHNWLITHAEVSDPASKNRMLVGISNDSNVVIADSLLYTTRDSSNWDVAAWLGADNGIGSDTSTCVAILRNYLTNIRFGIQVSTRVGSTDPAQNSIKVLAKDNTIKNFSGDGMRPVGSDITFTHNSVIDEYVSAQDGDGNHDDGMQGFALNGAVYNNVTIDHNWVQQTTDPSRKYNAPLQGISSFDGLYKNLNVSNNVVIADAYHGISWYGVHDAVIDHNTVIDPYAFTKYQTWIYAPKGKSGGIPQNVTLSNNVAALVMTDGSGQVTLTNNYQSRHADPATLFVQVDPVHNLYNLTPKPGGPLDGKNIGASLTRPFAMAASSAFSTHLAIANTATEATNAAQPAPKTLVAAAQESGPWYSILWHAFVNAIVSFFHWLTHFI